MHADASFRTQQGPNTSRPSDIYTLTLRAIVQGQVCNNSSSDGPTGTVCWHRRCTRSHAGDRDLERIRAKPSAPSVSNRTTSRRHCACWQTASTNEHSSCCPTVGKNSAEENSTCTNTGPWNKAHFLLSSPVAQQLTPNMYRTPQAGCTYS
jgi:hypothetical protein